MPCYTINEIDSMSFEEFVKKAEYPEKLYDGLIPYSKEKAISAWKTLQETFN